MNGLLKHSRRLYTVGPHTYIRTFPSSSGTNSSFLRDIVLKSFVSLSSDIILS